MTFVHGGCALTELSGKDWYLFYDNANGQAVMGKLPSGKMVCIADKDNYGDIVFELLKGDISPSLTDKEIAKWISENVLMLTPTQMNHLLKAEISL